MDWTWETMYGEHHTSSRIDCPNDLVDVIIYKLNTDLILKSILKAMRLQKDKERRVDQERTETWLHYIHFFQREAVFHLRSIYTLHGKG